MTRIRLDSWFVSGDKTTLHAPDTVSSSRRARPGRRKSWCLSTGKELRASISALPSLSTMPTRHDIPVSIEIAEYLRNKTPPPTNYMSIPYPSSSSGDEADDETTKKVGRSFSLRRRQKESSRRRHRPGLLHLPDTAVSRKTVEDHRYIAISIPVAVADAVPQPWPRALPWETEWTWDRRDVTRPEWRTGRSRIEPETRSLRAYYEAPTTRTLVSDRGVVTVLKPVAEDRESPSLKSLMSQRSLEDLLCSLPSVRPKTAPSQPTSIRTFGDSPSNPGSPVQRTGSSRRSVTPLPDSPTGLSHQQQRPNTGEALARERPSSSHEAAAARRDRRQSDIWVRVQSLSVPAEETADSLMTLGNSSTETVIPTSLLADKEDSEKEKPGLSEAKSEKPALLDLSRSSWYASDTASRLSPTSPVVGSRPVSRSSTKDVDEAYKTVERLVEEGSAASSSRPTSSRTARAVESDSNVARGLQQRSSLTPVMVVASVRPETPPVPSLPLSLRGGELQIETSPKLQTMRVVSPITVAKTSPKDPFPLSLRSGVAASVSVAVESPEDSPTDSAPKPIRLDRAPGARTIRTQAATTPAAARTSSISRRAKKSTTEQVQTPADTPTTTKTGRPSSRSILLSRQGAHVYELEQRLRQLERNRDAWRDSLKPLLANLNRTLGRIRAERGDDADTDDRDRLPGQRAARGYPSWYSADAPRAATLSALDAEQSRLSLPVPLPSRPVSSAFPPPPKWTDTSIEEHRPRTAHQEGDRGRRRFFLVNPDETTTATTHQRADRRSASASTSTSSGGRQPRSASQQRYPASLRPRSLVMTGPGPSSRSGSASRGSSRTRQRPATAASAEQRLGRRRREEEEERERRTEARIEFLLTPGMVDLSQTARVYHFSSGAAGGESAGPDGDGGGGGGGKSGGAISGMDTLEPLMRELMGASGMGLGGLGEGEGQHPPSGDEEDSGDDDGEQDPAGVFAGF
ncbi:hypothetical protein NKR23_g1682 [Pleurostoma richardsiae]|uniref:Uncharacterized protein n=1 Tax=Pleurostoma richardsiae TaxID=41990 RepID=A0AA38RQ02_9PEZI|nr:hypothetical protein NKR23_g1682 [Pleurostoma richardsiae]